MIKQGYTSAGRVRPGYPRYAQGYLPKIKYWLGKLNEAHNEGNLELACKAEARLAYFTQRQEEVYG